MTLITVKSVEMKKTEKNVPFMRVSTDVGLHFCWDREIGLIIQKNIGNILDVEVKEAPNGFKNIRAILDDAPAQTSSGWDAPVEEEVKTSPPVSGGDKNASIVAQVILKAMGNVFNGYNQVTLQEMRSLAKCFVAIYHEAIEQL